MTIFFITLLWLCVALPQAHSAASDHGSTDHNDSCVLSLVVHQAVQLQQLLDQQQEQSTQLQQQAARLQEQSTKLRELESELREKSDQQQEQTTLLQQQAAQLQRQSTQLQQLETQLQENSDQLRGVQDTGTSRETPQESASASQDAPREAFRAVMMQNRVTAGNPVRFDTAQFTMGEGRFGTGSGVYTVATPGVYWFGFQLFPVFSEDVKIDLYVSGSSKIVARCYNAVYETSCAASSVFRLKKGDTVWVQTDRTGDLFALNRSFFSGALISPDP